MVKKVLSVVLVLVCVHSGIAQSKQQWVDSVFQTLSVEEKIGQLFLQQADLHAPEAPQRLLHETKAHGLGGWLITGGSASLVKNTTQQLQDVSKVPLLIGLEAEWGAGKVLDSAFSFPKPLFLSTLHDSLLHEAAYQVSLQLKSLGVNFNIVSAALLPTGLTGDTLYSFWGNEPQHISKRSLQYIQKIQQENILVCAKNFPAQLVADGGTVPSASDSNRLIPFQTLMQGGVAGILPSSLTVPLVFERQAMVQKLKFTPTAISSFLTNTQVKKSFDYEGLLFVKVPDIKLTSGKIRWGEPELFAFQTGNDLIIDPQNVSLAIKKIKKLVKRDKIYAAQLDRSVHKILTAKYEAGLSGPSKQSTPFEEATAQRLTKEIYRSVSTIVKDDARLLPFQTLDNKRFASLSIGLSANNTFNQYLARYTEVDEFCMSLPQDSAVFNLLTEYDQVIVGIFPFATAWQKEVIKPLQQLAAKTTLTLIHFGNPESIVDFNDFETLVSAYTDRHEMSEMVAEQLFGALPIRGTLPMRVGNFSAGQHQERNSLGRLGFASPDEVEMDANTLDKIRDIAYEAINAGATPGCRVVVARKGKIIYDHSFGWLTYENQIPVTEETIYDLASVTKVSATLQTTAFLYEKGLIDLNKKLSVYLPELKGTNKEDFIIKDILTHQAGLWPFLPFWAQTMKDSLHLPQYYARSRSAEFPFDVSHNLFAVSAMKDSLWQWIIKSKVREKPARTPYDYRYSDMGFYMLQRLAERLLNQSMEDFLSQNLYEPLGASTLGYLPLSRFPDTRIAPTEKDKLFRKSLLTGYVHDQGAAMHGGIAGHAGLFGNAYDLAKLGQLWLNKGSYAGLHYFKSETVSLFTRKQYEASRRGLGWDKRDFTNDAINPTSKYSSANTFGHTGFTGTCLWVDPDHELVYVFLSNRVHPDMNNNKLLSLNIRTRIHDVLYEAIFNYKSVYPETSSPLPKLTRP